MEPTTTVLPYLPALSAGVCVLWSCKIPRGVWVERGSKPKSSDTTLTSCPWFLCEAEVPAVLMLLYENRNPASIVHRVGGASECYLLSETCTLEDSRA
eukprot:1550272-Amphidinium_carterae.1